MVVRDPQPGTPSADTPRAARSRTSVRGPKAAVPQRWAPGALIGC